LTELFEKDFSYNALNTARSALSSINLKIDNYPAGSHPTVVRFLKGVYNLRPPMSRYQNIWDVNDVLCYLKKLSPVKLLTLKDLTLKLAMLIALTHAARAQTLQFLSIVGIQKLSSKFVVYFDGLLKQSRPSFTLTFIELEAYPPDRRLCVYTVLKEYLNRTKPVRKNSQSKRLFLSYVKPYSSVSRDTISRWIRTVMARAGVDTSMYKSHSVRAAASSKAKISSVPIGEIMSAAGWSNAGTFSKFYQKAIQSKDSFSRAVLQC